MMDLQSVSPAERKSQMGYNIKYAIAYPLLCQVSLEMVTEAVINPRGYCRTGYGSNIILSIPIKIIKNSK